jgi:hypothetical protein
MDTAETLELDQPRPANMPDEVIVSPFTLNTRGGPAELMVVAGGGRTWTTRELNSRAELLRWLERSGYRQVAGTNPPAYRLAGA